MHFVLEHRARAETGERPDVAALADDGVVQDAAREDLGVRADHAVAQHDVGADAHAVTELDGAFEDHVDVDVDVAADLDRAARIEARGVDEGHALRHQLLRAPAAVDGFHFGQLLLVVHAQHLVFAVGDDRLDRHPVLDCLYHHVGQVVLALRVVVLDASEPALELRRRRGHQPRIHLVDRALLRRSRPCARRCARHVRRDRAPRVRSRSDPSSAPRAARACARRPRQPAVAASPAAPAARRRTAPAPAHRPPRQASPA